MHNCSTIPAQMGFQINQTCLIWCYILVTHSKQVLYFHASDQVQHGRITICATVWCSTVHSDMLRFLSSSSTLPFKLRYRLSSNAPRSPSVLLRLSLSSVQLSVQAIAQWTLFKQTKHKLYINKQITSFIFPVGCQTSQGPLLLNCQHSSLHSPHWDCTNATFLPRSLPLALFLTHK